MINRSLRHLDYIHCYASMPLSLLQPYRLSGYCFYRRRLMLEQSFSKRQFPLRSVTQWRPCPKGWRRLSTEPSQLPCSLSPAGLYRWGMLARSAGSKSSKSTELLRWYSWGALAAQNRGHILITCIHLTKCFKQRIYHFMCSVKWLRIQSKIKRKPQMGMLRQGAVLSSFSYSSVTCFLFTVTSLANISVLNHFLHKKKPTKKSWLQRHLNIWDWLKNITLSPNRPYRL